MAKDYYRELGVSRTATDDEIKKAYKKMALKFHPDRNKGSAESTERFKAVSEAYEVLSDPEKRRIYDQFGEDGLKNGGPMPPGAGGFPGGATYSTSGFPGGASFHFNPRDPNDIFREFFGARGFSFGGGGGGGGGDPFGGAFGGADDSGFGPGGFSFSSSGGGGGGGDPFGGGFRGGRRASSGVGHDHGGHGMRKAKPIKRKFGCTLQDLYTGTVKKMKVTRTIADASGKTMQVDKICEINVHPGSRSGTTFKFPECGNEAPGTIPADMIFELEEKPHPLYVREGDNLVHSATISLKDALTGTHVMLDTLSGRKLKVNVRDIVRPDYQKVIANEGMPMTGNPSVRGDLIIRFHVVWPSSLTDRQKELLREAL